MTWPRSKEVLLVGGVLLAQVIVVSRVPIPHFRPDMSLIPLTIIALFHGGHGATVMAFFAGLLLDCLSLGTLGFHAFSKSMIVIILGVLGQRIIPEHRVAQISALIFAVLLQYGLHFGLRFLLLGESSIACKGFIIQIGTEVMALVLLFLVTHRWILRLLLSGGQSGGNDAHSGFSLGAGAR